jgi:hypothetical protein
MERSDEKKSTAAIVRRTVYSLESDAHDYGRSTVCCEVAGKGGYHV